MLDTSFKRPVGDIGNSETFSFPINYETVPKATISRVVKEGDVTLVEPFVRAAKILEKNGCCAITTSCGFLALYQIEIQKELNIPFFSSSLMQIPFVHDMTGGIVGVITARKSSLTEKHLCAVHADHTPTIIEGMDHMSAFTGAVIEEDRALNSKAIHAEVKQVTAGLLKRHTDIRAIVLECTNLPPYKTAIREVTDLPVFDITTFMNYVYQAF